jgi:hypothetical protein
MLHLRADCSEWFSLEWVGRRRLTVDWATGGFRLNKRKRVAWKKHRLKAKKTEEKRKLGVIARRTK